MHSGVMGKQEQHEPPSLVRPQDIGVWWMQRLKTRHPELPALVQSFPGLCHLEIVAPTWQPQQLIYLSRLSRLRHLAVDTREVWGTSCEFRFDALRSCSGIVQLTLSGVQVDCAAGPKELPQLQCLALQVFP